MNGGSIRLYICKNECEIYDKKENYRKIKRLKIEEENFKIKNKKIYRSFDNKINIYKKKYLH